MQVGGPGAVLQDGLGFENYTVIPSNAVKGAGMLAIANTPRETIAYDVEHNARKVSSQIQEIVPAANAVGYWIDPRANTEYSLINLTLEST